MSFTDPWMMDAMVAARLEALTPDPSPNSGRGEWSGWEKGLRGEGSRPPSHSTSFIAVCLATALAYIRRTTAYTIEVVRWPIWPVLYFSTLLLAYRVSGRTVVDGVGVEGFLLVGTIGMVLWTSNLWASGYAIESERFEGTIASLLLTPASRTAVIFGYALGSYIVLVVPTALVLGILAIVAGVQFQIADPLAVALAGTALAVGAASLGYVLAGAFVLSRRANLIANSLQSPIYLLSGMAVPVAALPEPLGLFARIFPISAGMDALRQSLLAGASIQTVGGDIARLMILSTTLLILGFALIWRVEHVAKRGAELDFH